MLTKRLNRRTVLKGSGAIAIGLPLLDEMITPVQAQQKEEVPIRAFNLFFGLGCPAPLQTEGFDDVLEPLKPLADKLLILRNVDQVRCDESGINAHFDGACGSFTAEAPAGEARAGGASIDQLIRHASNPAGLPKGMIPTLIGGTFFRRSRICRYVHSYNEDGTVAARMQEKPRELFDRVFGTLATVDAGDTRTRRLRRSVLDSVLEQYRYYTGPNSPLGKVSRGRVADHLDRIREFEQRAYEISYKDTEAPRIPPQSKLLHGGAADPGGEGIDITLDDLREEWRLMADLYALAVKMDRVRFGALTFLAAGERIRLTGEYTYEGRQRWKFDDANQLRRSGSAGCSHEFWHQFRPEKENLALRAHVHMKMNELAYFMKALDSDECRESNGKTILENSLITISTESGDGRHNDVKRELSGVFHAITSANGRFKTGQIMDVGAEGIDVYNTMLTAFNSQKRLGPEQRDHSAIDKIRA